MLREGVAPEPHAVARRYIVRGKMDLHDHPYGRPNAERPNLKLIAWVKRGCETWGTATFGGGHPTRRGPSRLGYDGRGGCRILVFEGNPDGLINSNRSPIGAE
jgi:hypothetical protein